MKKIFLILYVSIITMQLWAQKSNSISNVQFKIKLKQESFSAFAPITKIKTTNGKTKKIETGLESMNNLNEQFQVENLEALFLQSDKFAARHIKHGLHLWYMLTIDSVSTEQILQIIAAYSTNPNVEIAEPVILKSPIEPVVKSKLVGGMKRSGDEGFPNDVLFSKQWGLKNNRSVGADIDVQRAWAIQKGDPSVIVAVIDGGVDYRHQDLAASMWKNDAEAKGIAGVDDDNNGFVDDIHGWNFKDNKSEISPVDHGTHVAGVIAAVSNNSKGIAGIAGGDGSENGVKIMSCQIFGNDFFDIPGGYEQAFIYAADNGAVIALNSWGETKDGEYGQSVLDAIDYFIENAGYDENNNPVGPMQGGLVVFAAGNNSTEKPTYPAFYKILLR
ncbi:MAG: S8 family serine peptidase [Bacteroidales bacterium]|nr:S8 family serine peptidase [Bacteroidales bacterium]